MHAWYLIRYGLTGRVGQFASATEGLGRGQAVVVRSHRGTELGEVLLEVPAGSHDASHPPPAGSALVLRGAGPDDLERARQAGLDRDRRFEVCRRVFEDGVWPLDLVDVEPLLDDRRTVLHYLGPHRLDVAGLRSVFRESCDLDVVLEPVGRDVPEESAEEADPAHACPDCGSPGGGCGSGSGGCSTEAGHGGGCSDCGVKKLLAMRRAGAAR
jgi:hypothetical protein